MRLSLTSESFVESLLNFCQIQLKRRAQESNENITPLSMTLSSSATGGNRCGQLTFPMSPGALFFSTESPIDPVANQMEQTFPLKIYREKRNTFRDIPLFSVFSESSKNPVPFAH